VETLESTSELAAQASREIASLDRELERLTGLAALGGAEIPAVLEALRARQARRESLARVRGTHRRQLRRGDSRREIESALRARLSNYRDLIRRNVSEARLVLETLLSGRIAVTPHATASMSTPIFDVRIPLTTRGIFEICGPKGVASLTGFEPVLPP
jgi:hypothetical protein